MSEISLDRPANWPRVGGMVDWCKHRERPLLLIGAAAQIVVLAGMIGLHSLPLLRGKTVLLRVQPVDPRDIFRGDYVTLSYEFSRLPAHAIPDLPDEHGNESARFFRGYRELTPSGLTLLINRETPLVIDLSSIQDYDKGHIPGARHVAMSQFDPENKELTKARELAIAVYCKNGQSSSQAASRLVKAGFKHVYWLGGGLASWKQADLPTSRGNR